METKTFGKRQAPAVTDAQVVQGAPPQRRQRRPLWRWVSLGLVLIVTCFRAYPLVHRYLQPHGLVPTGVDLKGHEQELATKYPNDPLARASYGTILASQGRNAEAETELKAAMADLAMQRDQFPPLAETAIRATLGVVLNAEAKVSEAKSVIAPACGSLSVPNFPQDLRAKIVQEKLCG